MALRKEQYLTLLEYNEFGSIRGDFEVKTIKDNKAINDRSEATFDQYAQKSSLLIDRFVKKLISRMGFQNFKEIDRDLIQKAVFYQVEHWSGNDNYGEFADDIDVSGGSVNFAQSGTNYQSPREMLCDQAIDCMRQANIIPSFMGLRRGEF